MLKKIVFTVLIVLSTPSHALINIFTDVNWDCMFPMTMAGLNIGSGDDVLGANDSGNSSMVCSCAGNGSAKFGVPIGFWEPFAIVDTSYEAWHIIPFNLKLDLAGPYMLDGARSNGSTGKTVKANVHYITFPVFKMLDMFLDLPCLQNSEEFDLASVSEVLPFFQNDLLSLTVFPETLLLSNPATLLACIADATASAVGMPIDSLFYCLGSGNLYPISGVAVGDNVVAANSENAARGVYLMGRHGLLREYAPNGCFSSFKTIWTKSRYRFHLWHPMRQAACATFGFPELAWTSGLPADQLDNDMSFMMWRKVDCCTMGGN